MCCHLKSRRQIAFCTRNSLGIPGLLPRALDWCTTGWAAGKPSPLVHPLCRMSITTWASTLHGTWPLLHPLGFEQSTTYGYQYIQGLYRVFAGPLPVHKQLDIQAAGSKSGFNNIRRLHCYIFVDGTGGMQITSIAHLFSFLSFSTPRVIRRGQDILLHGNIIAISRVAK